MDIDERNALALHGGAVGLRDDALLKSALASRNHGAGSGVERCNVKDHYLGSERDARTSASIRPASSSSLSSSAAKEHSSVSDGLCYVRSRSLVIRFTTNKQRDRFSGRPVNSWWARQSASDAYS